MYTGSDIMIAGCRKLISENMASLGEMTQEYRLGMCKIDASIPQIRSILEKLVELNKQLDELTGINDEIPF